MPGTFRIRNWRTFQHYRDRNPPWIKLHCEILSSEDWVSLDDDGKLLAIACMVIAAKNDGEVPNNPDYVKRVAYLEQYPNFGPLVLCGFLEDPQADASALLAVARTEKETQVRGIKKDSSDKSDPQPLQPEVGTKRAARAAYPESFEQFWKAYPTDPNMSKPKAAAIWAKLSPEDRDKAIASVPGFRAFCAKDKTYRPVHAVRYLSERRFDGFAPTVIADPARAAEIQDKADRLMRRGKYADETVQ